MFCCFFFYLEAIWYNELLQARQIFNLTPCIFTFFSVSVLLSALFVVLAIGHPGNVKNFDLTPAVLQSFELRNPLNANPSVVLIYIGMVSAKIKISRNDDGNGQK